ncbi:MAG: hypothetical protein ACOVNO_12305 [Sediminibacterium sp.]
MAIPYSNELDTSVQQWIGGVKMALPEKHKPTPNEVIFIDVSKSRYLLPLNSDSTENDVIVNRKYLTSLFQFIAKRQNKVKYILTDIIFDTPSSDDSALIVSIHSLKNKILCINNYGQEDSLQKNILNVRSATATVNLQNESVYKIPFIGNWNDTLVPYKMYQDMGGSKIHTNFLYTWFNNKGLAFNTQIHDYLLRGRDFTKGEYIKIGLGELVSLLAISPEVFDQYLQNKYILIGDFENDVHDTYLNAQPGLLILFNAYLHIEHERHILSIWYLLLLYLLIYLVVWMHAANKSLVYKLKLKVKFFEPFLIPVNIISISIVLIVFTFISSLLFGVNLSVFHLIAIFSIVETIQFFIGKLEKKSNQKIYVSR